MIAAEIRDRFLRFFSARGHQVVPSSPLVPAGDPTLLFTNAGMVQFKDVFLGLEERPYRRAVSVQKCMRAGGKHNDLDQVGRTARHQTFFEMLGNFSFGDYFKTDAIRFAWEFLTEELGIDRDVLWITVHESDHDARELWAQIAKVDDARIVAMGDSENFWSMGDTGPCGPCSEIYVDRGREWSCGPDCGLGRCDCGRFEEIWNLVFMQYERDTAGVLTPLPRPSIDTGMGLERVAAFLQGVDSNFDTDVLAPVIAAVARLSQREYSKDEVGMPFRVIADHVRALSFLLAEGVSFSNEGRGYVMRRILRRAVRYGLLLGLDRPFLAQLVPVVADVMGSAYPEITRQIEVIQRLMAREEERFFLTLAQGMRVLEERLDALKAGAVLSGEAAFELYDTYGFPLDLTLDAAEERGIRVDGAGFGAAMAAQRARARANRGKVTAHLPSPGATRFLGYETLDVDTAKVGALYIDEDGVHRLETGQGGLVWLEATPFYPEGGGQVGDQGRLEGPHGVFRVLDVRREGSAIWHIGEMESGWLAEGDAVRAQVDAARRFGAMRNHTGTHLVHAALRRVLGETVRQTGSLVAPDRLRFDFSLDRPMTADENAEVEDLVKRWILEDKVVETAVKAREEALAGGALAFFGDKYGEAVRVVTVPGASQELCGGTHCWRTGQIGSFIITEESGVGSGMRRIEAATGWNTLRWVRQQNQEMQELSRILKAPVGELPRRAEHLEEAMRELERQLETLRAKAANVSGERLMAEAATVGQHRVVVAEVDAENMEQLRERLDRIKSQVNGAVLYAIHDSRVSLVVYCDPRLQDEGIAANALIRELAPLIGGGGGGRPDLAQAGGKNVDGVEKMAATARDVLRTRLVPAP